MDNPAPSDHVATTSEVGQNEGQIQVRHLRARLQIVSLFLLTATVVYLSFLIIRPFMPVLLWALALGVVATPLHRAIHRRIKGPNLAAAITVVLVAVTIVLPFTFTARQLTAAASDNAEILTNLLDANSWRGALKAHPTLARGFDWADAQLGLSGSLAEVSGAVIEWTRYLITGSVWSALQFILVFFTLFYLFRDRALVLEGARRLVPLSDAESARVFREVYDTIYATLYGTLLVAIIQGALGALIFWALGISGVVVWGIIMALVAVVPYLGPVVVWAPVAIYLALQGELGKAIVLTVWGAIVVGFIDNLLYPVFVGSRMRFHTLPVFFFLLGGIALFGASGLILGPVVLALLHGLVRIWGERTEVTAR